MKIAEVNLDGHVIGITGRSLGRSLLPLRLVTIFVGCIFVNNGSEEVMNEVGDAI